MLAFLAGAIQHRPRTRLVRLLERHLGALQQLIGALAMRRRETHPARHAQIQADALDVKAAAHHRRQLLGVQQRALGAAAAADDEELRLADARHGVAGGDVLLQSPRRLAQHLIAHLQAEGGVDVAQVAQLDEQQRAGARRRRRSR